MLETESGNGLSDTYTALLGRPRGIGGCCEVATGVEQHLPRHSKLEEPWYNATLQSPLEGYEEVVKVLLERFGVNSKTYCGQRSQDTTLSGSTGSLKGAARAERRYPQHFKPKLDNASLNSGLEAR